ncbi:MAG TPA: hypothetical protein VD978_28710 [Azospirillum sp.]|nr:hypothetical protein [Azospirillum sp.]
MPATKKPTVYADPRRHAYLKPVLVEGLVACAVHDAEGTCLWLDPDWDNARAILETHGVEALSVH